MLVALLRDRLSDLPSEPLPEHLMDAKDWLGGWQAAEIGGETAVFR